MANRVKEEERIEKIIRGLLKLPENKRCINCNSLGPQYVCTTFWTFVCTTCSGIHREFTHRVKSISMAKFTVEEISALQAGGNERARQIYLKAWDPQRHSFPDGSNMAKLREYIKHVYVDRKYAGERNTDHLPPVKLNKKNDNYDRKSGADSHGRLSYERPDSNGRSDVKYYHDEWKSSPRYARENSRSGGFKRSPIRFEVVDDRFRDDGNARGRRSDPRRASSVEVLVRSLSPVPQKNINRSMSPVVRPVADLLGEKVPQLQVGDTTKGTKEKGVDASPNNHSTLAGGSCSSEKVPDEKKEEPTSLIDFDMDPQPITSQTITENETKKDAPVTRGHSVTTLESLLFELNVPTDAPPVDEQRSTNNDVSSTVPSRDTSAPAGDTSLAQGTLEPVAKDVNYGADQLTNVSIPPALHSASDQSENVTHGQQNKATNNPVPSLTLERGSVPQQSGSYIDTNNNQGLSVGSLEQSIQAVSLEGSDVSSTVVPTTPVEEAKTTGRNEPPSRKELPADLFSLSYPQVPGWQTAQPHVMGFGMHYHPAAYQTAGFPKTYVSTNPFDSSDADGGQPDQTEMFPSMAPVHGVSTGAPTGFLNIPAHGTQLRQHPLYSSATLPSAHFGHDLQPPTDSPIGPQGLGAEDDFDFDFGSLSSAQPPANKSSAPITQKSLPSLGRNPFE